MLQCYFFILETEEATPTPTIHPHLCDGCPSFNADFLRGESEDRAGPVILKIDSPSLLIMQSDGSRDVV